ncbi:MAG: hypothetical protein COT18_07900 [Elusimicrobia bacterium CG08_land_8_20_14_0_20_59_10]|nr:MAG: hypothetical protein COT18_07900 [Elusimicrobia bacterium CG08_land_8_20_14_0_20_59_10]
MGRASKTILYLFAALLAAGGFCGYAAAMLTGGSHRILISEMPSVGNTTMKTGGPYALFGNTTQLGEATIAGGRCLITWGMLNAVRPAQLDVSSAHVFPNPCNVRAGCNGVTFTRLTLNAEISVFTISGERVRKIHKTGNIDGIGWDLKNEAGSRVASGLYLYFINGGETTRKGKIVVIR